MPPRFHPRDFMVDPGQFGEDPDVLWKAGTSFAETCQIAAAYGQHLASFEVRRALDERGQTAEWLAGQLGQNAVQVRRKLDGDYPALTEDIAAWALATETVEVVFAPGSLPDLLPPAAIGTHVTSTDGSGRRDGA